MFTVVAYSQNGNYTVTEQQKDNSYHVEITTKDKTMSQADKAAFEQKIDNVKDAVQTVAASVEKLDGKVEAFSVTQSNVKLVYLAQDYNITKKDITAAVAKSKHHNAIAFFIPAILVTFLWWRLYKFKSLNIDQFLRAGAFVIVLGIATWFIVYNVLELLLNPNMAILHELQKLL